MSSLKEKRTSQRRRIVMHATGILLLLSQILGAKGRLTGLVSYDPSHYNVRYNSFLGRRRAQTTNLDPQQSSSMQDSLSSSNYEELQKNKQQSLPNNKRAEDQQTQKEEISPIQNDLFLPTKSIVDLPSFQVTLMFPQFIGEDIYTVKNENFKFMLQSLEDQTSTYLNSDLDMFIHQAVDDTKQFQRTQYQVNITANQHFEQTGTLIRQTEDIVRVFIFRGTLTSANNILPSDSVISDALYNVLKHDDNTGVAGTRYFNVLRSSSDELLDAMTAVSVVIDGIGSFVIHEPISKNAEALDSQSSSVNTTNITNSTVSTVDTSKKPSKFTFGKFEIIITASVVGGIIFLGLIGLSICKRCKNEDFDSKNDDNNSSMYSDDFEEGFYEKDDLFIELQSSRASEEDNDTDDSPDATKNYRHIQEMNVAYGKKLTVIDSENNANDAFDGKKIVWMDESGKLENIASPKIREKSNKKTISSKDVTDKDIISSSFGHMDRSISGKQPPQSPTSFFESSTSWDTWQVPGNEGTFFPTEENSSPFQKHDFIDKISENEEQEEETISTFKSLFSVGDSIKDMTENSSMGNNELKLVSDVLHELRKVSKFLNKRDPHNTFVDDIGSNASSVDMKSTIKTVPTLQSSKPLTREEEIKEFIKSRLPKDIEIGFMEDIQASVLSSLNGNDDPNHVKDNTTNPPESIEVSMPSPPKSSKSREGKSFLEQHNNSNAFLSISSKDTAPRYKTRSSVNKIEDNKRIVTNPVLLRKFTDKFLDREVDAFFKDTGSHTTKETEGTNKKNINQRIQPKIKDGLHCSQAEDSNSFYGNFVTNQNTIEGNKNYSRMNSAMIDTSAEFTINSMGEVTTKNNFDDFGEQEIAAVNEDAFNRTNKLITETIVQESDYTESNASTDVDGNEFKRAKELIPMFEQKRSQNPPESPSTRSLDSSSSSLSHEVHGNRFNDGVRSNFKPKPISRISQLPQPSSSRPIHMSNSPRAGYIGGNRLRKGRKFNFIPKSPSERQSTVPFDASISSIQYLSEEESNSYENTEQQKATFINAQLAFKRKDTKIKIVRSPTISTQSTQSSSVTDGYFEREVESLFSDKQLTSNQMKLVQNRNHLICYNSSQQNQSPPSSVKLKPMDANLNERNFINSQQEDTEEGINHTDIQFRQRNILRSPKALYERHNVGKLLPSQKKKKIYLTFSTRERFYQKGAKYADTK